MRVLKFTCQVRSLFAENDLQSKWFVHFQMVKMAKKLKKEKVNIDIINFGEEVLINTVR